ncbi:MBL fold metallo-hydrolase, partial [Thermodesulfobacteriota bacterium]
YLLQSEKSKILIDLGLSMKELEARLSLIGVLPNEIDAVLVTHEHNDHVKGVFPFSRRYGTKVYINYPTIKRTITKMKKVAVDEFDSAEPFTLNDLKITPFSVSHDAADPVGFAISAGDKKVAIATDLGIVTNLVRTNLMGCDALVIESNHDPDMLMSGPYPWFLKQRVRGREGHLSNEAALELLGDVVCEKTKHVFMAHLSEVNNAEQKVIEDVIKLHKKRDNSDISFTISCQKSTSEIIEI